MPRPLTLVSALFMPVLAFAAPVAQDPPNVPEFRPAFENQTRAPALPRTAHLREEVLTSGVEHGWGIAALPEGGYLLTERPGRMRVMQANGALSAPIKGVPPVFARRQGGLLDVALSPDFARDRVVFWTYAKPMGGGRSVTAAARGVLANDLATLGNVRDIFVQSPPSRTPAHYGSRILLDRAGYAFITTGEHFTRSERKLAQDKTATYGKVIRVTPEGAVPEGNPFGNAVWSLGHRNIQGAAFDRSGQLWAIEHGPKGGDELNRIEKGANYGWPVISYGENYNGAPVGAGITKAPGMAQPAYYWDPVIAPAGMVFYGGAMFPEWRGNLLIASLNNPGGLVRLRLKNGRVTGEERMLEGSRIRDVEIAPNGALLLLVDAPDGQVLRLSRE